MKKKYSDQELIERIKEKATSLGRVPRRRDFTEARTISARFDGFNNALKLAGLVPTMKFMPNDELVLILKKWANRSGRTPRKSDFDTDISLPSSDLYTSRFGSWNKALSVAGLDVNIQTSPDYSDSELMELLKRECYRIQPTSQMEFDKKRNKGVPTARYFSKRLNKKWSDLLLSIGIDEKKIFFRSIPEDTILEMISDVKDKLGHPPSTAEFDAQIKKITSDAIEIRFGKPWNEIIKKAGFQPSSKTPDRVIETNDELIRLYRLFSEKIGKAVYGATAEDLNTSDEIYAADVFIKRFGGMQGLKKCAGFSPAKVYPKKYNAENIIAMLQEKGRISNREINEDPDLPSVSTLQRLFQTTSMNDVWKIIFQPKTIKEKILALPHEKMTPREIAETIGSKLSTVNYIIWHYQINVKNRKRSKPKKIHQLKHLVGEKFGRLSIIEVLAPQKIKCKCSCGNERIFSRNDIINGKVVSCGCFALEIKNVARHGQSKLNNITHDDIKNLSLPEIAEKHNLSIPTVSLWAKKNEIKLKRKKYTRTHKNNKPMRKKRKKNKGWGLSNSITSDDIKNLTQAEIARKYNVTRQAVSSWGKRNGVKFKK